mmetsp:Transcript_23012/g.58724  ORF Transcript_23012/g.58724 Transcript_23012/m.58724 type:complete len:249 (-) Transcript_23012:749-1495(-)
MGRCGHGQPHARPLWSCASTRALVRYWPRRRTRSVEAALQPAALCLPVRRRDLCGAGDRHVLPVISRGAESPQPPLQQVRGACCGDAEPPIRPAGLGPHQHLVSLRVLGPSCRGQAQPDEVPGRAEDAAFACHTCHLHDCRLLRGKHEGLLVLVHALLSDPRWLPDPEPAAAAERRGGIALAEEDRVCWPDCCRHADSCVAPPVPGGHHVLSPRWHVPGDEEQRHAGEDRGRGRVAVRQVGRGPGPPH